MLGFRVAVAVFLIGVLGSCGDNATSGTTIADHVRAESRFSSLESSLHNAGLLRVLDGSGPFTLFAFQDGEFDPADLDSTEQSQLLSYHIHEGELTVAQLQKITAANTTLGSEIHIRFGLNGVLLNDGVKIEGESIEADNGIIHVLDRPISRPLHTETKNYESNQNKLLETFITDGILIEDTGFIHSLQVSVDIRQSDVSNLYVFLRHADTGAFLRLARGPRSGLSDINTTFADSAAHDVIADVQRSGEPSDQAFPEATYRPVQPLEYMVGEPIAGVWELLVYDYSELTDASRLRSWSMSATIGEAMPAPAIVLDPRRTEPGTLARSFHEVATVEARRVGGLVGAIELRGTAEELSAETSVMAAEEILGSVRFVIPTTAELGARNVSLSAQVGEVSRILSFESKVVQPMAEGMELLSHVPLPDLGATGQSGNDIWGWTDPDTGAEIAIIGTSVGTAFVDLSDPTSPVVLGTLPTQSEASTWRDIKVYQDHAFIVSEAGGHGMQIFDLRQLRDVIAPQTFAPTTLNLDFGSAHNVAINEDTAMAYVVGGEDCNGGMLSFDISTPTAPTMIGCFSGGTTNGQPGGPLYPTDVYTHDIQCVTYQGPDTDYQGREICFSSDEQSMGIADFSVPASPRQIVRETYDRVGYTHQGWLTEDHEFFILNDEFDEIDFGIPTRSYVWDVRDLDNPELFGFIDNPSRAIGHNTYVHQSIAYQANYTSGLRLVDTSDIANGMTPEVAYFDTYPEDDKNCDADSICGSASFDGVWSVYPFFASGVVVISDMNRGLFVVRRR